MALKGVNKMTLVGNVGKAPDIRYDSGGSPVANFTVATGEYWRDKATGENRETTEWHQVVVFGKLAEVIRDRVTTGTQLYLEGKNKTRQWTDNNGIVRYTTEVVVEGYHGLVQILAKQKEIA